MKLLHLFSILALFIVFVSCDKEKNAESPGVEKVLRIEPGYKYYTNENNDAYELIVFSPEQLIHQYAVEFQEGKKYHLSVSGGYCGPVYFALLNQAGDLLFTGEQGSIGFDRKYIVWTSTVSETLTIVVQYTENINFHTYEYHLTFEEVNSYPLSWEGLELECSGDWFTGPDGKLGVALHGSSYSKWASIAADDLSHYSFSVDLGFAGGVSDTYSGVAIFASGTIRDMVNLPEQCDEFKIVGPASWEVWFWRGGVGREWGTTAVNLNMGYDSWNRLAVDNTEDTVKLSVNNEMVYKYRNISLLSTGLLLVADDQKEDTLWFKNPELLLK
ncbi:MAG: hypothetical protein Kow00127_00100 [Bacteroidales bacterium]